MSRTQQKLERLEYSIQMKDKMQEEYRKSQEKSEKAKQDLLEAEIRANQLKDEKITLVIIPSIPQTLRSELTGVFFFFLRRLRSWRSYRRVWRTWYN